MQAGFHAVALRGCSKRAAGGFGGENRSGGDANGTPRNWFTNPRALGKEVVFPMTRPALMVAVGASWALEEAKPKERHKSASRCLGPVYILERARSVRIPMYGMLSFYARVAH
jgi:hypothetical protein